MRMHRCAACCTKQLSTCNLMSKVLIALSILPLCRMRRCPIYAERCSCRCDAKCSLKMMSWHPLGEALSMQLLPQTSLCSLDCKQDDQVFFLLLLGFRQNCIEPACTCMQCLPGLSLLQPICKYGLPCLLWCCSSWS